MKLIRFGNPGDEKPGVLTDAGDRQDLSGIFSDWNHDFFRNGGLSRLKEMLRTQPVLPVVNPDARWAAPVGRPGKVVCVGLNYLDHVKEMGLPLPAEPVVFQKAANTVVGAYDHLIIPRNSVKTDWEAELGVIIGKNARYLATEAEAADYVAGYCVANDVSERAFQLERGGQWTKGKSSDNFCPLGPFMLTANAVADVNNLHVQLSVNGLQMQNSNTKNMIFKVPHIIHYLSQFMTLEAGDLILTGTPPGVGSGHKPQIFLKAGDVVELSVEELGMQRQLCVDAE